MTISQSRTQELACGESGGRPHLKVLERDSFTECWLTVLARTDLEPDEACRELFVSVAGVLSTHEIQPIQEKIYGLVGSFDEIKSVREASYRKGGLDADLPVTTYLEGVPVQGGHLAGIQIWGIMPKENGLVRVSTLERDGLPAGRSICGPGFQMVYLPSIQGKLADGALGHAVTDQAELMFANAEEALACYGMTFLDVARTWIYLSRILHWYGEFNRVRSTFFKSRSVGDENIGQAFPASTGIQARTGFEECLMDVLAVKTDASAGTAVRPLLHSKRQDRAFKYGSAFSRGISILVDGKQTVHISGTASIGPDGATRYLETVEAQIMETLLSIAALLEPVGGGLKDITSSTLFCKDASYYQIFKDLTRWLGIPGFPVVPVVADVCRSDLLVEIEAVATIPSPGNQIRPDTYSSAGGAGREGQPS